MTNLAIIPARGGSKRIPRKNIRLFLNKPIIQYAIEVAKSFKLFDEIHISTEDDEIAEVASGFGVTIPFMRSKKNSDDFANLSDVVREVLAKYRSQDIFFDNVCIILPTSALINIDTLNEAYLKLIDSSFSAIIAVVKYQHPIQRALKINSALKQVQMIIPENDKLRTQDFEKSYYDSGQFYWIKTKDFLKEESVLMRNTGFVELSAAQSQDIDDVEDWITAERKYEYLNGELLKKNRNGIERIILGTVQLGLTYGVNNDLGKQSLKESIDLLVYAYNSGIRILDTAEIYGDAQKIIGQYHSRYPTKRFHIISKFLFSNIRSNSLAHTVNQDLSDLNIDFLYGYMFHSYEDYHINTNTINELTEIKASGLITKLGVSIYTNEELRTVIDDPRIDFVQLPLNLLDNSFQKGKLISLAKKNRKEIHVRSIFLQGLLFKDRNRLPQQLLPLKPYLLQIDAIAASAGITRERLALNYIMGIDEIDFLLIGVDNKEQLKTNLASITLTDAHHDINNKIDQIKVQETYLLNPNNWT